MTWQWGILGPLFIEVYTDWRWHKIFNWLTVPTFLSGLLLSFLLKGLPGLISSAQGAGLCFLFFLFLFLLGGMGAGDVKLMAGIGAWLGFPLAGKALIFTTIAGGVLAIAFALRYGMLEKVLLRIKAAVVTTLLGGNPQEILEKSVAPPFPYGLAIAAGTVLSLLFPSF
ncbi:MAG TPA: prepilin peptidase [Chroococcales cyanobacterium]|jgi:prepilin peptidase CpaA